MAKITRRKMLVSGGAVALGASAAALVGEAFAAQPKMTSHEYTDEEIKAIAEPLHAKLRVAMEQAGLWGNVFAGFCPEGDYAWARWTLITETITDGRSWWSERHFLGRIHEYGNPVAEKKFVAWFTAKCAAGHTVSRGLNGLIPAVQWHPDA